MYRLEIMSDRYVILKVLSSVMLVSFFFFKQKTAYEMRISDWSSDVCSSDCSSQCPLNITMKSPSSSLTSTTPIILPLPFHQTCLDDSLVSISAINLPLSFTIRLLHRTRLYLYKSNLLVLYLFFSAVEDIVGADRERRSEEHTSELQSLMRISYAVLSLTKKITTQYLYYTSLIDANRMTTTICNNDNIQDR